MRLTFHWKRTAIVSTKSYVHHSPNIPNIEFSKLNIPTQRSSMCGNVFHNNEYSLVVRLCLKTKKLEYSKEVTGWTGRFVLVINYCFWSLCVWVRTATLPWTYPTFTILVAPRRLLHSNCSPTPSSRLLIIIRPRPDYYWFGERLQCRRYCIRTVVILFWPLAENCTSIWSATQFQVHFIWGALLSLLYVTVRPRILTIWTTRVVHIHKA